MAKNDRSSSDKGDARQHKEEEEASVALEGLIYAPSGLPAMYKEQWQ